MPATEQLTIIVDTETAEIIRQAVASGTYQDEAAVIEASIREAFVTDVSDSVLKREVLPVYDAMIADPSRAIPLEEARLRMAERHKNYHRAA